MGTELEEARVKAAGERANIIMRLVEGKDRPHEIHEIIRNQVADALEAHEGVTREMEARSAAAIEVARQAEAALAKRDRGEAIQAATGHEPTKIDMGLEMRRALGTGKSVRGILRLPVEIRIVGEVE